MKAASRLRDTNTILFHEGYRLAEDAWSAHGRRTYIHDDDASREQLLTLRRALAPEGWVLHSTIIRALTNTQTRELIELEPGGPDTTGHFLHHLKDGMFASD